MVIPRSENLKVKSMKLNFVFNIIKTLMTILFPAISFPYASRILGVEELGAVQYGTSIISYFSLFAALGISVYAVREGAKVREDRKKLSKFSSEILIINLITTTLVYGVLFLFIALNAFEGYVTLILVCSLLIPFTTLSIEWLYQITEDYAYISLRSIITQLISLVLLFIFVKSKEDYIIYAFITVFSTSGYFLLNLAGAKRFVDFFKTNNYSLAKHIKPILLVFGVSIASSIYLNIDVVMLGAVFGDYEVGLYSVAMKINVIVRNLIASVSIVVLPRLTTYLYHHKFKENQQMLKSGIELNLMLSIPAAVGIFMLSKQIIIIVSGSAYVEATFASQILAINMVFSSLNNLLYYQVLIPFSLEKRASFGTIFGALMNIFLNFLWIYSFSYNGVAVATAVSELLVFLIFLFMLKEKIDIKYLFKESYKVILGTLPIIPICYFGLSLNKSLPLTLILIVFASMMTYAGILYLLKANLVMEVSKDIRTFLKK